ncbi:predicted protein [Chaetoceros tenuissimus]|uniref:Uncharacterized protein n=1 Tax=Chaetoceros tenuissimus TaxID=426638 RepID=A0AAD3HG52_9STRA|nr:predicted protein [Chaetoceros tenuissimus]
MKSPQKEVDAYKNPTKIFQLISESASPSKIISHLLSHPNEAKTWIASQRWKYLPIHLVCMSSPSLELLQTLVKVYRKSILMRDYFGNLPLFYLLQHGGDVELLEAVMDDDYSILKKKDGNGLSIEEMIQVSDCSEVEKEKMMNWFHRLQEKEKRQSNQFDHDEVYSLQELQDRIQQLEWECDAKDQTIDSLSAQLMSLVESRKKRKGHVTKNHEEEETTDMSKAEKIKDLESKLELDAKIVSQQEESIESLTKRLENATNENKRQEDKNTLLEQQIQALQLQLDQHDEAVAHVRKVSTILQTDLDDKEKEVQHLTQKLQDAEKDNALLKNQMEQQARDAELRLEAFHMNVRNQSESLQTLLQTLKSKELENQKKIEFDVKVLNERIAQKDVELLALERQLSAALERNVLLTEQLAEKDLEMDRKLMDVKEFYEQQYVEVPRNYGNSSGNGSALMNVLSRPMQTKTTTRDEPVQSKGNQISESSSSESSSSNSDSSSSNPKSTSSSETHSSMVSTVEIREKQAQLQTELRDIYSQIQAAMQVRKSQSNDSLTKEDSLKLKQLLEEKKSMRPWNDVEEAKEENKQQALVPEMEQDEVYNAESWGVKSGEGSIYSM